MQNRCRIQKSMLLQAIGACVRQELSKNACRQHSSRHANLKKETDPHANLKKETDPAANPEEASDSDIKREENQIRMQSRRKEQKI